jgi:hypothetical protein
MASTVFPAAGGGIRSVQRGLAAGSGNVTITAVDVAKSFVTVFGTASSGTVAVSGIVGSTSLNSNSRTAAPSPGGPLTYNDNANMSFPGSALSGGTNNLIAAVVQGFLANSTTLTVSGACRFEVVEFA